MKVCIFAALQIALISTDLEERILPDEITLGGVVVGLVLAWFVPITPGLSLVFASSITYPRVLSLIEAAIGAGVSAGMLWMVAKAYERVRHREGMGFGDIKMVAMIGAFLGLQGALLTLIAGSVFGGFGGLIYIAATRKDRITYQLPFGSFLGVAALAMALFGNAILRWYVHSEGDDPYPRRPTVPVRIGHCTMKSLFDVLQPGDTDWLLAQSIDPARMPEHIAIIMDGNGRWARRRSLPRIAGHRAGIDPVRSTVESCARIGVRSLTLYAFSVENWKRPRHRNGDAVAIASLLYPARNSRADGEQHTVMCHRPHRCAAWVVRARLRCRIETHFATPVCE